MDGPIPRCNREKVDGLSVNLKQTKKWVNFFQILWPPLNKWTLWPLSISSAQWWWGDPEALWRWRTKRPLLSRRLWIIRCTLWTKGLLLPDLTVQRESYNQCKHGLYGLHASGIIVHGIKNVLLFQNQVSKNTIQCIHGLVNNFYKIRPRVVLLV